MSKIHTATAECERLLANLKTTAGNNHRTRESVRQLEEAFTLLRQAQDLREKFYNQPKLTKVVIGNGDKVMSASGLASELEVLGQGTGNTPPNDYNQGEEDDFKDYYNKERSELCLGKLTD